MLKSTQTTIYSPVTVRLFFRKPRPTGNTSIEHSFAEMVESFPKNRGFILDWFESSYFSNGLLPRIRAILEVRRNKAAINHITGDTNFFVLGLPRRSTILTILDCGFMKDKKGFSYWIMKKFWLELPVKNSEIVTAISTATKQDIIHYTGCPPEKIKIVPIVIKSSFSYTPKVFRKDYPTILHVGISPNKNLERHAEAIYGLPCQLHLIGKLSDEQIALLKKLNIDYKISFNISEQELQKAYEEADILLFCSTIEGFGMPILEAQTVGRVVITSTISSMPEVAGEGACFANPLNTTEIRSAIDKVIADDKYRNKLIESGLENVKRFNPENVALLYSDLYTKIEARQRRIKQYTYAHSCR